MKAIGGTVSFLGGMAMLVGALFFLMSLKNMADLFIWSVIGMLVGGTGFLFLLVGWALYRTGGPEDQSRNHEMN
jgi:protein-S-isoprenylcysteine O-methyltransferase Ste14